MPETLLDTWLSRGVTILQGYGLTEAAPNVLCVPPEYAKQKVGSAGRPYLHVRVALRRGEEVIDGVATGELIVAGPNVFLGYWNNSEATSMVVRDGWLATGDVAARDEDGFYWMKGRLKDMYISGGENVYPAEIEQVLSSNPAIAVAAVVSVPHDQWGETGYAFVVLENGEHVSIDELTAYCRDSLASFKVPQWISIVEDLPLLGSGKVDKVRLSAKAQGESV